MTSDIKCPICGSGTRMRTRSRDKQKFYVCVHYPQCKGMVEYEEEWEDEKSETRNREGSTSGFIECPECGRPVSTLAESCPDCAYPITRNSSRKKDSKHNVTIKKTPTIEKTSKKYKKQIIPVVLLSIIAFSLEGIGFFFFTQDTVSGGTSAFILMGIGAVIFLIATIWLQIIRVKSGWHHGSGWHHD